MLERPFSAFFSAIDEMRSFVRRAEGAPTIFFYLLLADLFCPTRRSIPFAKYRACRGMSRLLEVREGRRMMPKVQILLFRRI